MIPWNEAGEQARVRGAPEGTDMAVIIKIKAPKPKPRLPTAPPGKTLKDRKKEAARLACRKSKRGGK